MELCGYKPKREKIVEFVRPKVKPDIKIRAL
jgi:hypothetical protein